jgi:hypothetical protein
MLVHGVYTRQRLFRAHGSAAPGWAFVHHLLLQLLAVLSTFALVAWLLLSVGHVYMGQCEMISWSHYGCGQAFGGLLTPTCTATKTIQHHCEQVLISCYWHAHHHGMMMACSPAVTQDYHHNHRLLPFATCNLIALQACCTDPVCCSSQTIIRVASSMTMMITCHHDGMHNDEVHVCASQGGTRAQAQASHCICRAQPSQPHPSFQGPEGRVGSRTCLNSLLWLLGCCHSGSSDLLTC